LHRRVVLAVNGGFMEITLRSFMTLVHGMLFGGFFLLAIFGVVVVLCRDENQIGAEELTPRGRVLDRLYVWTMAALGWAAVLTGSYVVYPWYRAIPPKGLASLTAYPKALLLASPATAGWHSMGMEWKEHVAWMTPIVATMLAYVWTKHRETLREHKPLRSAVLGFALIAFLGVGMAGIFGAMINKAAPVEGGRTIVLMQGNK
jgi:hypothetical protein